MSSNVSDDVPRPRPPRPPLQAPGRARTPGFTNALPSRLTAYSDGAPITLQKQAVEPITPTQVTEPQQRLPGPVPWPKKRIPLEIFQIIAGHLSRAEIKNLRLVCKEFEHKATAQYFRNVVVPFKSELYSTLTHDENGILRSSSPLFSSGMRIFQSFGHHIRRFALSLELDEDILAYPPIKPSQQAVPSFWGVYRWPHPTYHRYTDLEGLEQTADETEAMKAALKCLVTVTNLGLCCDAGLGFLSGPDINTRQKRAATRQPVFAPHNWRGHEQELESPGQPVVAVSDHSGEGMALKKPFFDNPLSFKRSVITKMAVDAGYRGRQIEDAIQLLLDTEDTTLALIDFDEREPPCSGASFLGTQWELGGPLSAQAMNQPLLPNNLTRAQKEMLLELEWAHRAMIQSYVIGLIDNASLGCFTQLTTLTIAKIPSCHVHILYRHELWESLSTLKNLHLGVIADWRRISKPIPGCIEDTAISPVEAVGKVFQLLDTYVGTARNIESLHFEWICGGEFAQGCFQRQHYVLPAPLFQRSELLATPDSPRTHGDELLSLPFVKHLSLKNCWAAPHIFTEAIRRMALSSLEKLELESVSLSGPPTTTSQAPLHNPLHAYTTTGPQLLNILPIQPPVPPGHAGHAGLAGHVHAVHAVHGPPPAPVHQNGHLVPLHQNVLFGHPNPNGQAQAPAGSQPPRSHSIELPDWFTWCGFIEHFSPGLRIRDILDQGAEPDEQSSHLLWADNAGRLENYMPETKTLTMDESNYNLKSLSFKSCGYVSVDCQFLNTRYILPRGAQGLGGNVSPYGIDLSPLMQRCADGLLGRIAPHLKDAEVANLTNAFDMQIGWENVYDASEIAAAEADGVEKPGRSRFSGLAEECSPDVKEARILSSLTRATSSRSASTT